MHLSIKCFISYRHKYYKWKLSLRINIRLNFAMKKLKMNCKCCRLKTILLAWMYNISKAQFMELFYFFTTLIAWYKEQVSRHIGRVGNPMPRNCDAYKRWPHIDTIQQLVEQAILCPNIMQHKTQWCNVTISGVGSLKSKHHKSTSMQ